MSKLLISGDIHSHLFGQYATNKNTEANSRFRAIMDVLDQMLTYAIDNRIPNILINGDIFETKNIVESYVNNSFWDWCVKCSQANIKLYLNTGNHDISSLGNEQITLLYPYKDIPNVTVINKPTILNAFDYFEGMMNVTIIPYRRNTAACAEYINKCVEEIQKNPMTYKGNSDPANILLWHGSVMGARLKSIEYRDEKSSLTVPQLRPDFYDFVFLSHFHIRQTIADNVMYVGSPLHHDTGDAGDGPGALRGFYVIDPQVFKIDFIPTKYPSFNDILIETREDLDKVNMLDTKNYYRIKVTTPDVKPHELTFKSHNIKVCFDVNKPVITRIDDIQVDSNIRDIVPKYVKLKNPGLDEKRLIDIGLRYINKTQKGTA